jgi:hypothetical protein
MLVFRHRLFSYCLHGVEVAKCKQE